MTDRYVRTGTRVPQIYPGSFSGLNKAIADCVKASKLDPSLVLTLFMVCKGRRTEISQYQDGRNISGSDVVDPA